MHRRLTMIATATLALSACGGDGGSSSQPQTEAGAIAATTRAIRGTFTNDSGAVIDFMNAECRDNVDTSEVKQALALGLMFLQSDDYDLKDIEVVGTVKDFDSDTATIEIELIPPEGADDLGFLSLSNDDVDVMYENEKWVGADCDFDDTTESSVEDLDAELDALGLAGTQADPIPAQLAVPVGNGFIVSITDYNSDAAAQIEELGGSAPYIDDGEQIAMLSYDIAYTSADEPVNVNSMQVQLVGSDGVAIDQTGCGQVANQAYFGSRELFSGGATSVVSCFSGAPSRFSAEPVVSFEAGYTGRAVFFAPGVEASSPTEVPSSSGPSPDGDLTDDRQAPAALGSAVDIGGGWTMTVNGADLDAEAVMLAASDYNDPAPDGSIYVLLDVALAYDGGDDQSAASVFSTDIGLVGDSNLAADAQCNVSEFPDQLDNFADVFPGGTITGNVCFLADVADLDSLVVYATGEPFGDDPEFFEIR